MANLVKQFRFYGDSQENGTKNQPNNAKSSNYINGDVFQDFVPILQLGVQALPGTMFYLNNAAEPIIIGKTGIFELDLQEETQISTMRFDADSINAINNNLNGYLIVDIIYDSGREDN